MRRMETRNSNGSTSGDESSLSGSSMVVPSLASSKSSLTSVIFMDDNPPMKAGGCGYICEAHVEADDDHERIPVVLKFAHDGHEYQLRNEAMIYQELGKHMAHPRFYGFLQGGGYTCLLLENCGEALESFAQLDEASKFVFPDRFLQFRKEHTCPSLTFVSVGFFFFSSLFQKELVSAGRQSPPIRHSPWGSRASQHHAETGR